MKLTIPEVLPLIKKFANTEGNEVGGKLHIVLDDENIEDNHIEFCLEQAIREKDNLGIEVAETLLKMSKTQRLKLAKMFYDLQDE
jgi:adenine-specific DNA methylase